MKAQLNICSQYSLLESTLSIPHIILLAKHNQISHLALCDHNNMSGCFEFYEACQKANIQPIFGLSLDVLHENETYHLNLLAQNEIGFKNLLKISTSCAFKGFKAINLEDIKAYTQGIVCYLSDNNSVVARYLMIEDYERAESYTKQYQAFFEHFYFGFSSRVAATSIKVKQQMRDLASKLNVECIVAGRVAFQNKQSTVLANILSAIKHQTTLSFEQVEQIHQHNDDFIHDTSFYEKHFTQQEIKRTLALAQSLKVEITKCEDVLVPFKNPLNIESKAYLKALCYKGLAKRMNDEVDNVYLERLNYELDVILKMNFEDYFLVVYDYVLYAKKNNMIVGPGRGSVTGSLVAYVLGITQIDPIKYQLFFERFLNPQRVSMPDIDIDFSDEDREAIIDYVVSKYGADHVCHIMTFGTMKAKMALRDVGRVFNDQPYQIDMLAKAIPNVLNITLDEAYKESIKLRNIIGKYKELEQVYAYARQLENLPRHISTHAAGIILSKTPLSEVIALQPGINQTPMAQHTMYDLEKRGLLKMDFLGLRNLSIITNVLDNIKMTTGEVIDLNNLDMNDPKTFAMIANGDTDGVFQLESAGMKQLLKKVKVSKFSDIYACNALFRPGPMENIDVFVKRKEGKLKIDYLFAELEPILKETYGIIVYQEQIMQIVQLIGGFSLADADLVRKAMSKKQLDQLQEMKQAFIEGAIAKGYDSVKVEQLYELILKFSNYGFNKGHSVAYGMIAYQMAYLKANYTLAFMACVLTKMIGAEAKIGEYLYACQRYKITILAPCLNQSDDTFKIEGSDLRYPLTAIKGVGKNVFQQIIAERKVRGPFKDEIDAIVRLSFSKVSAKAIQTLIEAGAFDCFTPYRSRLLYHLPAIMQYGNLIKVEYNGQSQLDDTMLAKPELTPVYENKKQQLEAEFQALGLYLSAHPTLFFEQAQLISSCPEHVGQMATLVLYLHYVKQIRTKTGQLMAFALGSDQSGQINLTFLPLTYTKYINFIQKEHVVKIYGKIEYGNELSILVNKVEGLDNYTEVKK